MFKETLGKLKGNRQYDGQSGDSSNIGHNTEIEEKKSDKRQKALTHGTLCIFGFCLNILVILT